MRSERSSESKFDARCAVANEHCLFPLRLSFCVTQQPFSLVLLMQTRRQLYEPIFGATSSSILCKISGANRNHKLAIWMMCVGGSLVVTEPKRCVWCSVVTLSVQCVLLLVVAVLVIVFVKLTVRSVFGSFIGIQTSRSKMMSQRSLRSVSARRFNVGIFYMSRAGFARDCALRIAVPLRRQGTRVAHLRIA